MMSKMFLKGIYHLIVSMLQVIFISPVILSEKYPDVTKEGIPANRILLSNPALCPTLVCERLQGRSSGAVSMLIE